MHAEIERLGATLIALSPQLGKYSKQIAKKNALTFPVLSDINNTVASQFGLVFTLPEPLKELYLSFGIDLTRFNNNDLWTLPLPGRFIVNREGVIGNVDVHPDYTKRPDPSEIVSLLQKMS